MEERDSLILERLGEKLAEISAQMHKSSIAEFVALYRRPWRLFYFNFLAGIFRGFGIAVGFTFVGAIFVYALGKLASLNLPVIGHFIAQIARLVELELSIPQ
ncbi:MAG: hypothetical protein GX030_02750 [Firmicutes bacterium]|nr:hypothetical protein [Bacillota bacterium]